MTNSGKRNFIAFGAVGGFAAFGILAAVLLKKKKKAKNFGKAAEPEKLRYGREKLSVVSGISADGENFVYAPYSSFTAEDILYLAKTVYGEMRGENDATRTAVAWTIRNRSEEKNRTIKSIVKQKNQYSAWNKNDPNFKATSDPENFSSQNPIEIKAWKECQEVAEKVLQAEKSSDPTKGATHYFNGNKIPNWVKNEKNAKEVKISCVSPDVHIYKGIKF